jgi:hypothetical protein
MPNEVLDPMPHSSVSDGRSYINGCDLRGNTNQLDIDHPDASLRVYLLYQLQLKEKRDMKVFVIVVLSLVILSGLFTLYKELSDDDAVGVLFALLMVGALITSLVFVCIKM